MPEAEVPKSSAGLPSATSCRRHHGWQWPLGKAVRGPPRAEGHRRGVEALRRTIRAAGEIGIGIITIFSFSAENWSRPATEVHRADMGLLRRFIRNDLAELHQK